MITVSLSTAQVEVMSWAEDALNEMWRDGSQDITIDTAMKVYPQARTCRIVEHIAVLADLKYRLLEQYPDVVEEMAWGPRQATLTAAQNAWKKVEAQAALCGITGIDAWSRY